MKCMSLVKPTFSAISFTVRPSLFMISFASSMRRRFMYSTTPMPYSSLNTFDIAQAQVILVVIVFYDLLDPIGQLVLVIQGILIIYLLQLIQDIG